MEDQLKGLEKDQVIYEKDRTLLKEYVNRLRMKYFGEGHTYNICDFDKFKEEIAKIKAEIMWNNLIKIKVNQITNELKDKKSIKSFDKEL